MKRHPERLDEPASSSGRARRAEHGDEDLVVPAAEPRHLLPRPPGALGVDLGLRTGGGGERATRVALIIGNADCSRRAKLANPTNDARSVAAPLRSMGLDDVVLATDASASKIGVSVADKFVGEGVELVVGHFDSGVSLPTSEIYAENGVLRITPSASDPKITECGLWNIFCTCGRDDQQGALWVDHAMKNLRGRKRSPPSTTGPSTATASPTPPGAT